MITDLSPAVATPSTSAALPSPSRGYGGGRSSQHNSALEERMTQGTCFRCKQPGHWQINCPFKGGAPEKPPQPSAYLPIVRCHCGRVCSKTAIAWTEFYTCSNPKTKCGVKIPAEEVKTIRCRCGAGAAALNVRRTLKFGDVKFYACRIKKGLGACGFLELENPRNRENKEVMALELERVKWQLSPEDYRGREISCPANHCEVESSTRNLAVVEVENYFPIMEEEATHNSRLMSRCEIHRRQMEFDNQMSAAAMEPSTLAGGINSSGCIRIADLVETSNGSSSRVVQHPPTRAELDWVTPELKASAAPENGLVSSSSNPKRSFSATQEDQPAISEVKLFGEKLQKELSLILQSLEQLQLHSSKKALQVLTQLIKSDADILQAKASTLMRDDNEAFRNSQSQLRSAVLQLEGQMQVGKSSKFAQEGYDADNSWLDGVYSIYNRTMNAFVASDEQLQIVSRNVSAIKDTLLKIGNQVQDCQAEIIKLETLTHWRGAYCKMAEAKTDIMAASKHLLTNPKSNQQRNEDHHSSGLPAEKHLSSTTPDMVREGKQQKRETSSTMFDFR